MRSESTIRLTSVAVTLLTALIAVFALGYWLSAAPAFDIPKNVPGMDGTTGLKLSDTDQVNIEGSFKRFAEFNPRPIAMRSSPWPNFRGPNHDNIDPDSPPLADQWPAEGPPVLWSIEMGDGYAGPAVLNSRVYVLDYEMKKKADTLRCFLLENGKELWRRAYSIPLKPNHGISRTIPAVTDKYVVTIGPNCHVMCVDTKSGDFKWGIDLVREYDTQVPLWYTGQCPLIDGSTAIIAPGGKALLIGVDCETGTVKWKTPNPDNWQMSHSSVIPMTFAGKKMYLYSSIGGMVGVSAEGTDAGCALWKTTDWTTAVIAPSPIPFPDGRIFVTAGYGKGSMMLQLSNDNGTFKAKPLYKLDKKIFACEQQTPILYKGHLFTVLPPDAGGGRKQFVCLKPDGTVVWTSEKAHRFGLGPFVLADNKIFILDDRGTLTMIEASTTQYKQLAQARVLTGRDAWGPMAPVDGKLILRDLTKMICIDLRKQEQ